MRTLTPSHAATWGKFNVAGMLAHLNDSSRMAVGELSVAAGGAPVFLAWPPVRYLVIHVFPFPKGAPTAPELLARCSNADLTREQELFAQLFDRLTPERLVPRHPAFGALTRHAWGTLIYRHTDHHLRQFGV
jgi:hypothetical protein